MCEPVHKALEIFFFVGGQNGIIRVQQLPDKHRADLCLALQAEEVE